MKTNRPILISGEINSDVSALVLDTVWGESETFSPKQKFLFLINSGGGEAGDGMALYDTISSLEDTTAIVIGKCYSAAILPLMACKKRYCVPNTTYLMHGVEIGECEHTTDKCKAENRKIKKLMDDMLKNIMMKHISEENFNMALKLSIFGANAALQLGFVHEVKERL